MSLVYLAAPYSSNDPDVVEQRIAKFCLIDAELSMSGMHTVSPLFKSLIFRYTSKVPSNWGYWKTHAEELMRVCTELKVIKLPGWDHSEGVAGEIELAKKYNISVSYIEVD